MLRKVFFTFIPSHLRISHFSLRPLLTFIHPSVSSFILSFYTSIYLDERAVLGRGWWHWWLKYLPPTGKQDDGGTLLFPPKFIMDANYSFNPLLQTSSTLSVFCKHFMMVNTGRIKGMQPAQAVQVTSGLSASSSIARSSTNLHGISRRETSVNCIQSIL